MLPTSNDSLLEAGELGIQLAGLNNQKANLKLN
jgi:hypothetical protein